MKQKLNCSKFFLYACLVMMTITHSFISSAESLSYSGRLVNSNGSPVSGPVDLKFELASTADTSTILCSQQLTGVALTNGVFHVKLDLNCGVPALTEIISSIANPHSAAIRVTNESATPDKIYSFQSLHSVPQASLSSTAKQLIQMGANNNEVLTWTGTKWEPKPVTGATGGTVTSITAGTGLSGGTITNSGTIAIANGGVTDAQIAAGVARSKLASGTANYVLVNDGTGAMSEVAQLAITQGGTGANTAAGARTNLGLGSAAVASVGYGVGQVMPGDGVPICLSHQKLQMNLGPTFWSCVNDNDSLDATKLPLAGGAMTGAIDMNANRIVDLGSPTDAGDAANKAYVDAQVGGASYWTKTGSDIYYNTGKVGIGINAPASELDVHGPGNTTTLKVTNNIGTANGEGARIWVHAAQPGADAAVLLRTNDAGAGSYWYVGNDGTDNKFKIGQGITVGITPSLTLDGGNVEITNKLRLKSDNANFVELKSPAALAATLTFNLPGTSGTSGQALITDGSGNLSWSTVATGASAVGGDLTGIVTNAQIAAGAIVDADIAAGAAIAQSKINGLSTSLSGKEPSITAGTTAQYWRGDKTWQTLNSAAVPELTNLYFTEPRVLGTDLAGYSAAAGAITVADTVLSAIEKLSGNLAVTSAAQANYVLKAGDTMSGALAMGNNKITGLATPTVGTDAATMAYVDSKVSAAPGDNLGNHTATTNLALGTNKILVGDGTWSSPGITFTNSLNTGLFNNGGILGFSANGGLAMNLSSSTLILNGSFAPYMRLGGGTFGAATPTYSFGGDTDTGIFNVATNILGFSTAGVERMRLLETGEMAIGKTTAAGKLDVAGNIALDGNLRLKSDNANYVELKAPASLAATLTYTLPGTAGTSGYALTTNGAGVLSWSAVATTASTVGGDLTGTIANAQIAADAVTTTEILDGTIGNTDIANTTITYSKLNLTDGDIPQAKVNGLVTALAGKEPTITAGTTAQYWRGDKTWQTLNTTAVPEGTNQYFTQSRVRTTPINSYVVGTAIPLAATDTVLEALGKLEAQIIANDTAFDNSGVWSKSGTDVYYNGGDIGIGTNNPQVKLHVAGSSANDVSSYLINSDDAGVASRSIFLLGTAAASGRYGYFSHQGAGYTAVGAMKPRTTVLSGNDTGGLNLVGTGQMGFWIGASEKMRIATDGSVGIGTSTPSAPLEVNGDIVSTGGSTALSLKASADDHTYMSFFARTAAPSTRTGYFGFPTSGSDNLSLWNETAAGSILLGTNGTEKMRILSDGKVGIGTTTPTAKLEVAGDAKVTGNLYGAVKDTSGNALRSCVGTSPNSGWIYYNLDAISPGYCTAYLDINTSACGFTSIFNYFPTLHGDGTHYGTMGTTSIYSMTTTGFRLYVAIGGAYTAANCSASGVPHNTLHYNIKWMGVGQ